MGLDKLAIWSLSIITALAGVFNIDTIHREIIKAQARILFESRTEAWGSPRFFDTPTKTPKRPEKATKKEN